MAFFLEWRDPSNIPQWSTPRPVFSIYRNNFEKRVWGLRWQYADGTESAWTAETKADHQKVQKILWQKILHDEMEDEIQQWNMQISEQKK